MLAGACARGAPPPSLPNPDTDHGVEVAVPGESSGPYREPDFDDDRQPDVRDLSLRDRAAQLVMPWISGDYWAADDSLMLATLGQAADLGVGGFVVGLGGSAYDLAAKFNAFQRAARLPLFIAADLESGPSMRVRGSTQLPGNMALGATGREEDAEAVGRIIAEEARAIGINVVFAPVVDVNNNPANPIINVRSFGEDPAEVGRLGAAYIRGLRRGGVLATAKHFPGHGDTGTDSHVALPVIMADRSRLDSIELAPFRAAVRAHVDAVMSAHVAMPPIVGSDLPATLSPLVLDTILRGDLRFAGLVVTDALNMGAIVSRYGASRAAVMALRAGADILLMPTDPREAVNAVVAAVERGEVSEARLDSSVTRILDAKARLGLFRRRTVDLERIARSVGSARHRENARRIAERSLVLVKDSLGLVPFSAERSARVLVVAWAEEGDATAGVTLAAALRQAGVARVEVRRLYPASGPASYDSVRTAAARASATVVAVAARPSAWRPAAVNMADSLVQWVQRMSAAGSPVMTVAFGSPYLIGQVPNSPGYLVAWSDSDPSEQAVADALMGRVAINGRLPVSLPPYAPRGAGLSRARVQE
jgi:beta-N-acetylhexosaminidase